MRPTTGWGLGMGLLMLCHLGTRLHSPGAEAPSLERLVVDALCQALPSRCPQGAAQTTADALWTLEGPCCSPPPVRPWRTRSPAPAGMSGSRRNGSRPSGMRASRSARS